jgi:hypothetical protein
MRGLWLLKDGIILVAAVVESDESHAAAAMENILLHNN